VTDEHKGFVLHLTLLMKTCPQSCVLDGFTKFLTQKLKKLQVYVFSVLHSTCTG
jgi:hypothetical protein